MSRVNQMDGGPLVTIAPQQEVWQSHKDWALYFLHTWTYIVTAIIIAASIGNVRNWHSTQSCAQWGVTVIWPWQLWCSQSTHSVAMVSPVSWMWTDDSRSIGTNTANSNHEAICCFFVSFTATKVRINEQITFPPHLNITFFLFLSPLPWLHTGKRRLLLATLHPCILH